MIDGLKTYESTSLVGIRKKAYNIVEPEWIITIHEGKRTLGEVYVRYHSRSTVVGAGAVIWKEKRKAARILNKDGTVRQIDRK